MKSEDTDMDAKVGFDKICRSLNITFALWLNPVFDEGLFMKMFDDTVYGVAARMRNGLEREHGNR